LALSLRGKSLFAVGVASALALTVAVVISVFAIRAIEAHYGAAFARNYSVVLKQRMVAPINRELALALRLARSEITRDWVKAENDPEKRRLFFREAEGYRTDFVDKSFFIASIASLNYYFNDKSNLPTEQPKYKLSQSNDKDAWFFKTISSKSPYLINVSPDPALGLTKVWLNFLVKDGDRNIAVAGTGIDLSAFVKNFLQNPEVGVTTMALDARGAIQAHRDVEKVAYRSLHFDVTPTKTLGYLLKNDAERNAMQTAMAAAINNPDVAFEFVGTLDKRRQVIALSWSPEMNWYVVAAADLGVAQFIDFSLFVPLILAALALFSIALIGFLSALNRLLLKPISQLTLAASQISDGNEAIELPKVRLDELGDLTIAFGKMMQKVSSHRATLEQAVSERTQALLNANKELAKISESDELTGLGNRRMLLARLKMQDVEVRKLPTRGVFTLALIDLDHFKNINDTFGHEAGDAVLVKIAQVIRDEVRATDVAGRWGGEEFLVILPGSNAIESEVVMQRLVQAIASCPIVCGEHTIYVKASIGVAELRPDEGINALMQRADTALYLAKDSGRNRVVLV
jgi:phosphoserine phosphatase RsbU/P